MQLIKSRKRVAADGVSMPHFLITVKKESRMKKTILPLLTIALTILAFIFSINDSFSNEAPRALYINKEFDYKVDEQLVDRKPALDKENEAEVETELLLISNEDVIKLSRFENINPLKTISITAKR